MIRALISAIIYPFTHTYVVAKGVAQFLRAICNLIWVLITRPRESSKSLLSSLSSAGSNDFSSLGQATARFDAWSEDYQKITGQWIESGSVTTEGLAKSQKLNLFCAELASTVVYSAFVLANVINLWSFGAGKVGAITVLFAAVLSAVLGLMIRLLMGHSIACMKMRIVMPKSVYFNLIVRGSIVGLPYLSASTQKEDVINNLRKMGKKTT